MEQETCKVGVHPFVARDKLVREGKPRHEAALLEPEYGGERSGEEHALNSGKRDEPLCEDGLLVGDPAESPVGLLLDDGDGLDGIEEELALFRVANVRVDQERVRF